MSEHQRLIAAIKDMDFKVVWGEIKRFLVSGFLNVGVTLFIYEIAVMYLSPTISYLIAWATGVFLTCVLYPFFVFKTKNPNVRQAFYNFLYYVVYGFVSVNLLNFFIYLGVSKELAPFATMCIVTPISFAFSKFIYADKEKTEGAA